MKKFPMNKPYLGLSIIDISKIAIRLLSSPSGLLVNVIGTLVGISQFHVEFFFLKSLKISQSLPAWNGGPFVYS